MPKEVVTLDREFNDSMDDLIGEWDQEANELRKKAEKLAAEKGISLEDAVREIYSSKY